MGRSEKRYKDREEFRDSEGSDWMVHKAACAEKRVEWQNEVAILGHRCAGSDTRLPGCPGHVQSPGEKPVHQNPVKLAEILADIQDYWDPHIVGELNGQHVKLARLKGPFVWHHHQNEDELFLVLKGVLKLELRDGTVTLEPGEFFIVPRGAEHRPVAEEEVHVLMFEPASTLNTGNVRNERTVDRPRRV